MLVSGCKKGASQVLNKILSILAAVMAALAGVFFWSSKRANDKAKRYQDELEAQKDANTQNSHTINKQLNEDRIDDEINKLSASDVSSRLRKYARNSNEV
jgi:preprotein translocase subunit SecG